MLWVIDAFARGDVRLLTTYGLIRGNEDGWGSPLIVGSLLGAAALMRSIDASSDWTALLPGLLDFEHQASQALGLRAGIVAGLDSVLAVAATTAFIGAAVAWLLLGRQRSSPR